MLQEHVAIWGKEAPNYRLPIYKRRYCQPYVDISHYMKAWERNHMHAKADHQKARA